MEYQSFKFGGRPSNAQAYRQTITPEEFQRRFDFYKDIRIVNYFTPGNPS